MYIWNTASEICVPLRRLGGGGVHLASWSPTGSALIASTISTVFRIWNTKDWQPERWNIMAGKAVLSLAFEFPANWTKIGDGTTSWPKVDFDQFLASF